MRGRRGVRSATPPARKTTAASALAQRNQCDRGVEATAAAINASRKLESTRVIAASSKNAMLSEGSPLPAIRKESAAMLARPVSEIATLSAPPMSATDAPAAEPARRTRSASPHRKTTQIALPSPCTATAASDQERWATK